MEARGQPRGLYYLAFTEAWERFSFYGMMSLLVLYMVDQLLLPGHAEHVLGLSALTATLHRVVGPLTPQATAFQIFGLYTGLVYFTPIIGGALADRWIGQRNAVVIGAILMAGGHVAMAFDVTFLVALVMLIIGSGFLKGNIATQVGVLYEHDTEARRARGFVIFSAGINVGSVAGPMLCGWLAQVRGWHYGFGAGAACMVLGLMTYLYGHRHLPVWAKRNATRRTRLGPADWRVIRALALLIGISIFHAVALYQLFNVLPVWIQQYVAPTIGGFRIPLPWYASLNAIFGILGVPLLLWRWRWQARRHREPDDLAKIRTGAWVISASNLILVVAILGAGGALLSPIWPVLYSAGLGIGFLYFWPTLLALVSQAAPGVSATMMGVAYLSVFVANVLVGWIGGLYERMGPAEFWCLHAAIAATGGVVLAVLKPRIARVLQRS